jgi:hypothetical protein
LVFWLVRGIAEEKGEFLRDRLIKEQDSRARGCRDDRLFQISFSVSTAQSSPAQRSAFSILLIIQVFAKALEAGAKVLVTNENAGAISLLANEFWMVDLLSECSALQAVSIPEFVTTISERVSKLEHQLSSQAVFASTADQISYKLSQLLR